MTAFGKILIFLNLVFAMVTAGLIGMVYLTRTNWKSSFDRVQAAAQAADASYKQLLSDKDAAVASEIGRRNTAIKERDELAKKLDTETAEIGRLQAQLAATQRTNDKDTTNVATVTAELEKRKAEVAQIRDQLTDRDTRIRNLEGQLTVTRGEAVTNKLSLDSLKERYQVLLTQNEEQAKQIARGAGTGIGTTSTKPSDKGPPPEQVRGTVKAVDGNLATISIGTDAGVNKDHVLYLFRLAPTPEYLGKLTILSATPFEAVGRIEPAQRRSVVKPGDEVASRIAGLK
ncbi:MAG: hypothetical protein ACJ8C4_15740 [Gemmataceae bacterium]